MTLVKLELRLEADGGFFNIEDFAFTTCQYSQCKFG